MRQELKKIIEELVISSIKDFKSMKNLNLKRIVLHTSHKISNDTLIFNYTQNRFYNQQHIIDTNVPIVIIPYYNFFRHGEKGDYAIDVGAFLEPKFLKSSAFSDF